LNLAELSKFLTLARTDLVAFFILLLFLIYFAWYSYCKFN
jgi:F0F1-type ATP synthase membrane subunit b/b'